MRRTAVGTALAVALVVLAGVVAMPAGAGSGGEAPAIELTPATTTSGSWIAVRGSGLPPGALVLVEICGAHRNPALGCDDATAVNAEVSPLGQLETPLLVDVPPAPCPCIVRVRGDADSEEAASAPLAITDAPQTAEPVGEEARDASAAIVVEVSDVALDGDGPPAAWFGASPRRTFRYTLTNAGPLVADGLEVELVAGEGDDAERLRAPAVGSLDPGESREFEVGVDLGAFHVGSFPVRGVLRGAGSEQRFSAETSSFPWMLVVIPGIVVLEVLLLAGRNRLRAAMDRRAAAEALAAAPDPEVAPAVASSVVARVQRTREVGVDTRAIAGQVVAGVGARPPSEAQAPVPPAPEAGDDVQPAEDIEPVDDREPADDVEPGDGEGAAATTGVD